MQALNIQPQLIQKSSSTEEGGRNRRCSQYEALMRKFSEAHKEECKSISVDIPKVQRGVKKFPTGSQYVGNWDVLGMSGKGTYTFPNGVIYEGEFNDGMFDGEGELQYPGGEVLKTKFSNGVMMERSLIFADGLYYTDGDFEYCKMPDRRYTIEYDEGLNPADESYQTAEQPPKEIPPGYYDCGDGFFNAETKMVYRYDDITAILRSPYERERKWMVDNCRMNPCKEMGPRPDLYEDWVEPEEELEKMPLPACMSVGTRHLFMSSQLAFVPPDIERSSRTVKWNFCDIGAIAVFFKPG
ncbi:MORN repeat-containing protein 5-like isoform X2 [Plodia interpunctella]|uniref:MORN repeat-containing protein 5-like isoform X2 n=1 Tax=Plodia interpunctella TaxID=58824 RepID=UPI002367FC74|nr:MORN repeat-containing protein 5-like isoform X2 [Plodia interpunctella]